jgi:porphyrinogen peroxidase
VKPTCSHSSLTTIEENGKEIKILRDNMPFGRPTQGEFGTYFIGYSKSPSTIELMLQNMFVGRPPGNYDRLLDFSRAVTGNLFFVPSATFLEDVSDEAAVPGDTTTDKPCDTSDTGGADETGTSAPPSKEGSLGIGSLKGDIGHE